MPVIAISRRWSFLASAVPVVLLSSTVPALLAARRPVVAPQSCATRGAALLCSAVFRAVCGAHLPVLLGKFLLLFFIYEFV